MIKGFKDSPELTNQSKSRKSPNHANGEAFSNTDKNEQIVRNQCSDNQLGAI